MADLFTLSSLSTLVVLILLQAVLGIDNLLYISIESKRVDRDKQSFVRRIGIALAIVFRIALLFILLYAIGKLQEPFFQYGMQLNPDAVAEFEAHGDPEDEKAKHHLWELNEQGKYFAAVINVHSVIVLLGGIFIIYTAFKEIFHMLSVEHLEHEGEGKKKRSVGAAVFWIVLMNLVFSFDSILSALALTRNAWVMTIAIVLSGVLMIVLADRVAEFLKKNRMYEVLGLFILLIVGVMLISEGGHLAHLHFFGHEIVAMSKSTFYFVIFILIAIDIVQSRYQKKLMAQRASAEQHQAADAPA